MPHNDYHFITVWRVQATLSEINAILADGPDLARWWPSVYLDVQEVAPGDQDGLGKVISLYTKGWLPYTLRWQFRVTELRLPFGFTIKAWGDFEGRGIWTFEPEGSQSDQAKESWVRIIYDWQIVAEKPLLKYFSFIMKPIFSANHHWAMARGDESLNLELARRHAKSQAELALIPKPPGPTFGFLLPKDGKAAAKPRG
jgi:hypothetical protein